MPEILATDDVLGALQQMADGNFELIHYEMQFSTGGGEGTRSELALAFQDPKKRGGPVTWIRIPPTAGFPLVETTLDRPSPMRA